MKGLLIRLKGTFSFKVPSYGLASLASVIKKKHDVEAIDCLATNIKQQELFKKIDNSLSFIAFSCMYQTEVNLLMGFIKKLRLYHLTIKIIVGGLWATNNFRILLFSGADYVIIGEGENILLDLLDTLENRRSIRKIKGIAYIRGKQIIKNQPNELISLDKLPIIRCDSKIFNKYRYLETSRGCNHCCSFCFTTRFWGHQWRGKSISRVILEFERAKKDGIRYIQLIDDNFAGNDPQRIEGICKYLIENKFDIRWGCSLRSDFVVDFPEKIRLMKRAGCDVIFIGFESMNNRILSAYSKAINVTINMKALEILRNNKIFIYGSFILGGPSENLEEMKKTIRFARKCDIISLCILNSQLKHNKKMKLLVYYIIQKEYIKHYFTLSLRLLFEKNRFMRYIILAKKADILFIFKRYLDYFGIKVN